MSGSLNAEKFKCRDHITISPYAHSVVPLCTPCCAQYDVFPYMLTWYVPMPHRVVCPYASLGGMSLCLTGGYVPLPHWVVCPFGVYDIIAGFQALNFDNGLAIMGGEWCQRYG